MLNIQIVVLSPEDWRAYRQLRLEALIAEPQAFGSRYANNLQRPDSYWQERLRDAMAREDSWLLFARENDQLVGMIGAFRIEEEDTVEIVSVYVTKAKRGQGVGDALMAAMLAEVEKKGVFRKAVLGVNQSQTAAVALYKRFGFQIVGEKAGAQGDGLIYNGYMMEKRLGQERRRDE